MIGEPITPSKHLDVILESLPKDFESTINIVTGKFKNVSIEEIKTLLLCHESRLDRFCRNTISSVHANLTISSTASNAISNFTDLLINLPESHPQSSYPTHSANFQAHGSRGGCVRGRNGHGSSIQCHVYRKYTHEVSIFYHRFKRDCVPSISQDESPI